MSQAPQKTPPSPKAATPDLHEQRYTAGDVIFNKGDRGGDIFFIVAGQVDIFDVKEGKDIVLSTMREGEIIGLLTCLTGSPRTAHARAKDNVTLKKVPHDNIKASLQNMPKWMSTVIKEFSIRLQNTNDAYATATLGMEEAKRQVYGPMTLGLQFVSLLAYLSESMTITVDGQAFVVIEDAINRIADLLVVPPRRVQIVYEAFLKGGLLKVEIEPDRKRKVIAKAIATSAKDFIAFHQKAGSHPTRKWVRQNIPDKSMRAAAALVTYARKQSSKPSEKQVITGAELAEKQEKITGCAYDPEALVVLKSLELLNITWNGQDFEDLTISFTPATFGRTLAYIRVYRLLMEINFKESEKIDEAAPKAKAS